MDLSSLLPLLNGLMQNFGQNQQNNFTQENQSVENKNLLVESLGYPTSNIDDNFPSGKSHGFSSQEQGKNNFQSQNNFQNIENQNSNSNNFSNILSLLGNKEIGPLIEGLLKNKGGENPLGGLLKNFGTSNGTNILSNLFSNKTEKSKSSKKISDFKKVKDVKLD